MLSTAVTGFSHVTAWLGSFLGRKMAATYLSIHDKDKIIFLHQNGMKPLDIALKVGKSKRSVQRVLKEFKDTGEIAGPKKKTGRPRITSSREDRKLERIVKQQPFKTQNQYREAWKNTGAVASRSTIRLRLKESEFKRCRAKRCPMLKKWQRKKRVTWANQHRFMPRNYWNRVLWSDESYFEIPGCRRNTCYRKKNQDFNPKNVKPKVRHPGGVMVWGCMSARGVGTMLIVNGKIDSYKYCETIEEGIYSSLPKLFPEENFVFMHDYAPAHNSKFTKEWLQDHDIEMLSWPSNSPDLNPIENLWRQMKIRIRQVHPLPRTKAELIAVIKDVWNNFPSTKCAELVKSMPERLAEVISKKGFGTKY